MFQDNPLLAQLKQQFKENIPTKEGTIKATEKGFGFLEVDSKTSYFIPPPYMKKCLHGDKVVALIRTEKEKEVAEPDELIEAGLDRFIACVTRIKGRLLVRPDKAQFGKVVLKAKTKKGISADSLSDGDWVVAKLVKHPLKEIENQQRADNFLVEIVEKVADANDKIAPWWVTLAEFQLPNAAPDFSNTDIDIDALTLNDAQQLVRQDMTDIPFVTIDGESTKDMDDALYAKTLDNGDIEMTIAIADPTAFISSGDAIDKEAKRRGFTIYLPGRNIPMLPRALADERCSLHQDSVRPALCCRVTINKEGELSEQVAFFAANIKSHARLIYDHVSDWIEIGECKDWQPDETIAQVITSLQLASVCRQKWRAENAVVFPDHPDYRFELNEKNDVVAIHADLRRSANRLVEEAMIAANICAGKALSTAFGQGIYNTHSGFKPEKLAEAIEIINQEGTNNLEKLKCFTQDSLTTLEGFSDLRRWLNTQNTKYLDNRIRKLQTYSEINTKPGAHYAMGLEVYATWTSPIRKYGDMINHRLLKAVITNSNLVESIDEQIGEQLVLNRKYHKQAERSVSDWLYTRTLIDEPNKETRFQAEIFDINRSGMRVRILENGATAFIPTTLIYKDKSKIEISSEQGKISIDKDHVYVLGDVLEVILAEVNIKTRSIVAKPTQTFSVREDESSKVST